MEFSRTERGGGGRGGGRGGGMDDRGPPGGGGMRSEMRCYECGEMGHFARDCRRASSLLPALITQLFALLHGRSAELSPSVSKAYPRCFFSCMGGWGICRAVTGLLHTSLHP